MQTTLPTLLNSKQTILGHNFENLGKSHGVLLSFDGSKGWAIEKFDGISGAFKWIFRYFGFYGSTQLSTIKTQLQKEGSVARGVTEYFSQKKGGQESGSIKYPDVSKHQVTVSLPENQGGERINGALFTFVRGDITALTDVEAIVNAANEQCLGGGGVDGAIHEAAGPELFDECLRLPVDGDVRCPTGAARVTGSGKLSARGIEKIIHTVGPRFNPLDPKASEAALRSAYTNSLALAKENGIRSIAFPSISTGVYGYNFRGATQVAYRAIRDYLEEYPGFFNQVKIVYFNKEDFDSAVDVAKTAFQLEKDLSEVTSKILKSEPASSKVIEVRSIKQFHEELSSSKVPVVVDFYASWCGPCKKVSPKLDISASALDGKVKFLKINIDKFPELSRNYQIRALPTVLLFDQGEEKKRRVGLYPISDLLEAFNQNHKQI